MSISGAFRRVIRFFTYRLFRRKKEPYTGPYIVWSHRCDGRVRVSYAWCPPIREDEFLSEIGWAPETDQLTNCRCTIREEMQDE